MTVLEVGSGRGGGLSYIVRYLNPSMAIGVDFSSQQIAFCQRNYNSTNIRFVEGDAAELPVEDESVDAVINVESSHCYPNFKGFIGEVARVLKPGGHFFYTDFLSSDLAETIEKDL